MPYAATYEYAKEWVRRKVRIACVKSDPTTWQMAWELGCGPIEMDGVHGILFKRWRPELCPFGKKMGKYKRGFYACYDVCFSESGPDCEKCEVFYRKRYMESEVATHTTPHRRLLLQLPLLVHLFFDIP